MYFKKIKQICVEKGMSVRFVEQRAGLSNGTISKWDESSPSVDKLVAVCRVLGIGIGDLIDSEVEKEGA